MPELHRARRAEPLDDDGLIRIVRGMAAVDRAVTRGQLVTSPFAGPQPLPPTPVALELGWRLCARCGRAVKPSWAIVRAGEVFHPVCIMFTLGERLASSVEGSSLPSRGSAGSRRADSELPSGPAVAA